MKVYPVVHVVEARQAAEQAEVAFANNADGVFLIDHLTPQDPSMVVNAFNIVDRQFPTAFIGVNLLGWRPLSAAMVLNQSVAAGQIARAPSALWADDVMGERRPLEAYTRIQAMNHLQTMRYMAGVAFKYTPSYTGHSIMAARAAAFHEPHMDTVVTSGPGTGTPPSLWKIIAMKQAIKGRLAVASGISADNVDQFRPYVDEVLAASSFETAKYSGVYDEAKLKDFIQAAHAS